MSKPVTRIKNGRILTPLGILDNAYLYFSGSTISAVSTENLPYHEEIDAAGCFVSPGFIDTHVHGGGGSDFMDGGTEPIVKAANFHLKHGTTTILPTTLACSFDTLLEFLADVETVIRENLSPSYIPGVHLEGPYFSQAQCGAQNPDYIKPPIPDEYETVIKSFGKIVKKWSFAPELAGSEEFCKFVTKSGIAASIGHSDGIFDDVQKAYNNGCRSLTHLYSGMSGITRENGYRRLGIIESAYYFNDMTAEVIADGKHLPPELLKIIVNGKGAEHICLVTDAMRSAGQTCGESFLGKKGEETPCIIEDGVAKLPDRSAFAGSIATADRLVRTMAQVTDVATAVKMITEVPARVLELETKGKLKENYDADIVIFDDNINIKNVIAGGKIINQE